MNEKLTWAPIQEILSNYLKFVAEQNENKTFDREFCQDEKAEGEKRDG